MQFGRLGKLAPVVDPRVPHLGERMMLAQPEPAVDWTPAVKAFHVLANDRIGDCTSAGCLNLLSIWYANNGLDYEPTDADAIALYSATSDYPKADHGAVEQTVLKYWSQQGIKTPFGVDKIAYASINPKNIDELKLSVQWFGGCYLGLALPLTAQTQDDLWDVVADAPETLTKPGSWGGHCAVAVAYTPEYVIIVTWGKLQKVTPAFIQKYADEGYAAASSAWLNAKGISPPGLDWTALTADMASLKD